MIKELLLLLLLLLPPPPRPPIAVGVALALFTEKLFGGKTKILT